MKRLLAVSKSGEFYFEFAPLFAQHKIILQLAITIQDATDMISKEEYSAIIIDITFIKNINMIKTLRHSSPVPIIAYCLNYNLEAKIKSLQDGADEYLIERGECDDLLASIKSLSRRYCEYSYQKKKSLTIVTLCGIVMNLNIRKVFINGIAIDLCKKEFEILLCLIKNKYQVISYEQIYQHVWGERYHSNSHNILWCQMHRLAMKINQSLSGVDYIVNVRGIGYQINPVLLAEQDDAPANITIEKRDCLVIIVIGYGSDELMRLEVALSSHAILCQKAESMQDALKMLRKNEYILVMINGDTNDYLLSTELVREMTLTPILVTATTYDIKKKTAALDIGADIYVQINEFIEDSCETAIALIRRCNEYNIKREKTLPIISNGDLLININNRKVYVGGLDIKLTRIEFDILRCIVSHKGEIVTYEQICELVWGDKYDYNSYKPLMLQVHRLRDKIKAKIDTPEYILNIRQVGYRLNTEIDF